MKKKLESDLISIAHKILQLKSNISISELKEISRKLYEDFTLLEYLENQELQNKSITVEKIKEVPISEPEISYADEEAPKETPSESFDTEKKSNVPEKPEIIIEEINARVTEDIFIPASEKDKNEDLKITQESFIKNDKDDVSPTYLHIEQAKIIASKTEKPKSLNDRLKKGIQIGLNDRLAFIKHLFEGNPNDYNRVISQLNTIDNKDEADAFIQTMIKPDYNWNGKEEYENRFVNIVLGKFDE